MPQVAVETNVNQLVGLFLAEVLRSRRTSIRRAAEISRRVLATLQQVKTEQDLLVMLSDIEKDFEEILILKQALKFDYDPQDIKVYENEIRQFASGLFETDMAASANFLQDASAPAVTIQQLCLKYPEFCQFLLTCSDKKSLLKAFV